jgi:translation initiation factor IF-2
MDKVRISEVAQELGMEAKAVLAKAQEMSLSVKASNSAISIQEAGYLMDFVLTGVDNTPAKKESAPKESKPKAKVVKKETPSPVEKEKEAPKPKETSPAKVTKEEPKAKETPAPVKEEVKEIPKEVVKETPKIVEPKEEPKAKETPEVKEIPEVKEEAKEPKTEDKDTKEQEKKEPLAKPSLKKRRGLMIVKKRKPKADTSSKRDMTMPELADGAKKKKKFKKTAAAAKHDESQKIDIFSGGDINAIDVMGDSEMVVLHDLNLNIKDESEDKGQTKKKFDPTKMRSTKNSSFVRQRGISRKSSKRRRKKVEEVSEVVTNIEIPEETRVYEFAEKIGKQTSDIIKVLFTLGLMVTKNDFLDKDAIEILAEEFEVEVTIVNPLDEFDYEKDYDNEEEDEDAITRPPVITIMGHVDHGKTSLLDKIRETKVAAGEHGGITQHVGAYMVERNGQKITFIDTPGHEAFTEMRSRGAQATDIVIIVVAADDGVKPQTKEAVEHAKAAGVPFIIAINKIDKPDANPDLAKSGLAELGVTPVDWGGDHEFINVSAHSGEGIDELLETLILQAEILELKANPQIKAKATVVETSLEKGRGAVATIIMQNGSLKIGDVIVCGIAHGKVKALLDEDNKPLKEILPGEPGVVVGLSTVPSSGDVLMSVDSDKEAREYANKRAEYIRQKELSKSTKVTLDDLSAKIAEGQIKNLPVILKADVAGSLEALKSSLEKLRNDEVKVNIISSGVGGISESDISLAEASDNSVILGFNVRPTGSVKEKAKKVGVSINTYNVIYDLLDDVRDLLGGLLSPIIREENLGQAEVREVFSVPKLGQIAGSIVTDGVINRGAKVRVIRDGVVIYEGEISSLKRFKDDAKEVSKGYECGIGVVGYSDIKPGDFLESFKEVEEKATL